MCALRAELEEHPSSAPAWVRELDVEIKKRVSTIATGRMVLLASPHSSLSLRFTEALFKRAGLNTGRLTCAQGQSAGSVQVVIEWDPARKYEYEFVADDNLDVSSRCAPCLQGC